MDKNGIHNFQVQLNLSFLSTNNAVVALAKLRKWLRKSEDVSKKLSKVEILNKIMNLFGAYVYMVFRLTSL